MIRPIIAFSLLGGVAVAPAPADDLYRGSNWSAMTADRKAGQVGDMLTVLIIQSAESSNVTQNRSHKATDTGGSIAVGHIDEGASLTFGGGFTGRGEIVRSEKLLTQITLTVQQVLPNGDLIIAGQQWLNVNGERTRIGVRGRVRSADIQSDNTIVSNRIADAQIDFDGRGFVSRSAKPGLINRIFSFLGLG